VSKLLSHLLKTLNSTYAFKCYQNNVTSKNVSWPHFTWATLYTRHRAEIRQNQPNGSGERYRDFSICETAAIRHLGFMGRKHFGTTHKRYLGVFIVV